MQQLKIILIVLIVAIFSSCSKEEFTPKQFSSTSYVTDYINVSIIDTIAKADSLAIILYDGSGVETCRIRFDIDHNRAPGSDVTGVATYRSFGFDTLIVDNSAVLAFLEGEIGTTQLQRFKLLIDYGTSSSSYINLTDATISLANNNYLFYGASGLTAINQFYHYQFGPIASFNIIAYN